MAFATVEEVRNQTTFSEVSGLPDARIGKYIELANAYLRRHTGVNYRAATDPDLVTDLERVTVLLVEYIWLNDQPEVKETNYTGLESEKIGTYSYNITENKGEGTGNKELDQLLLSLTQSIGLNFFSISGPSKRVPSYPYNPHTYVTDFEGE